MKKLRLDHLKVESFATSASARDPRGTVEAHEAPTSPFQCPYSDGGTCVITGCFACPTEAPCN
jgi:hypothetical protein